MANRGEADQPGLGDAHGQGDFGDSTLSVRYCKMKENVGKAGAKVYVHYFLSIGIQSHLLFGSAYTARTSSNVYPCLKAPPMLYLGADICTTSHNRIRASSNSKPKSKPNLKPTSGSGWLG